MAPSSQHAETCGRIVGCRLWTGCPPPIPDQYLVVSVAISAWLASLELIERMTMTPPRYIYKPGIPPTGNQLALSPSPPSKWLENCRIQKASHGTGTTLQWYIYGRRRLFCVGLHRTPEKIEYAEKPTPYNVCQLRSNI